MFCNRCYQAISDTSRFCPECGKEQFERRLMTPLDVYKSKVETRLVELIADGVESATLTEDDLPRIAAKIIDSMDKAQSSADVFTFLLSLAAKEPIFRKVLYEPVVRADPGVREVGQRLADEIIHKSAKSTSGGNLEAVAGYAKSEGQVMEPEPVFYLEIEFIVGEPAYGKSILSNLLGQKSLVNCEVVARMSGGGAPGSMIVYAYKMNISYGSVPELLGGVDRENAQKVLGWLNEDIQRDGWSPIASGPHWYSRRYTGDDHACGRAIGDE